MILHQQRLKETILIETWQYWWKAKVNPLCVYSVYRSMPKGTDQDEAMPSSEKSSP